MDLNFFFESSCNLLLVLGNIAKYMSKSVEILSFFDILHIKFIIHLNFIKRFHLV